MTGEQSRGRWWKEESGAGGQDPRGEVCWAPGQVCVDNQDSYFSDSATEKTGEKSSRAPEQAFEYRRVVSERKEAGEGREDGK